MTSSRYTVTRSDAVTVTLRQEYGRSDFQKRVVEEQADGLSLLSGVGACGAFVAAFRERAKIVFADVDRQSAKPSACPFPVGSH